MKTSYLILTDVICKNEGKFMNDIVLVVITNHGIVNYIYTKAKCRHLKNLPVKGLCGSLYLSEAPSPPMTRTPFKHCIRV
jgi:hypothetical protein